MIFLIDWTDNAKQTVAEAAYHYFEKGGLKLYNRFYEELTKAELKIKNNPQHFGYEKHPFRSILLEKFPYKIIFEIEANTVVIYQLFHSKQNPSKLHFNG